MSSSVKFTTADCVAIQKHVRVAAMIDDKGNVQGVTPSIAYEIAERAMEKMFHASHPSPTPSKPKPEVKLTPLPGLGGPDVLQHAEKVHTFSDNTTWKCCAATGCMWGRPNEKGVLRTKHSDGLIVVIPPIDAPQFDDEDADAETSADVAQELSIDDWAASSAGDAEEGVVPEPRYEDTDSCEQTEDELCTAN